MKLKLFIYLIFIFISISCSNPEKCQELIFEPIDKITTLNGELYTGRCTTYNDGVKEVYSNMLMELIMGIGYFTTQMEKSRLRASLKMAKE